MNTLYTKGIWRISQKCDSNKVVIFQDNNMSTGKIAVVNHNLQHSKEEAEANVEIICRAVNLFPLLVEALRAVKNNISGIGVNAKTERDYLNLEIIEELLKKAEQ